jgi:hypothetical protein
MILGAWPNTPIEWHMSSIIAGLVGGLIYILYELYKTKRR